MKKALALLMVLFLAFSFCSCGSRDREEENLAAARKLYDKMTESAALLDEVASDICSVWKDAGYSASTKKINEKITKVKEEHKDELDKIAKLDAEITAVFPDAKASNAGDYVERTMSSYIEYRDSVLKADAAFENNGYISIAVNKDSLHWKLNQLYVKL